MGWLDVAKVSCILRHRSIQLILAYSWARSAILVAGKGRRGMFLFLLFLRFHSCSSFFPVPLSLVSSTISSFYFLPFSGRRHKMTHKNWRVFKPHHNQFTLKEQNILTLVLLNQDMPYLCKQCRSRPVGFWSQLIWIDTVCHSVFVFVSTTWIKLSHCCKMRSGRGILIYSAWHGFKSIS